MPIFAKYLGENLELWIPPVICAYEHEWGLIILDVPLGFKSASLGTTEADSYPSLGTLYGHLFRSGSTSESEIVNNQIAEFSSA